MELMAIYLETQLVYGPDFVNQCNKKDQFIEIFLSYVHDISYSQGKGDSMCFNINTNTRGSLGRGGSFFSQQDVQLCR